MKNLVIGDTSQVSYYFPEDYVKISSRNIDFISLNKKKWDRVFLCFGESRKFITDQTLYDEINFDYTINVIKNIINSCNSLIVFATCELWNGYEGPINLELPFNFIETNYLKSKLKLVNEIKSKDKYKKVKIVYPFNYNSVYRSEDFLFGKVFKSIINNKKITIGDTNFKRDITHPTDVVKNCIKTNDDIIVGSGALTFVNGFIRDLYSHFNMDYEKYVTELSDKFIEVDKKNTYFLGSDKILLTYDSLLSFTIKDIKNLKL